MDKRATPGVVFQRWKWVVEGHYIIYIYRERLNAISLWSFLVMLSRMYLGVHSPADIVAGGVVGCLLLVCWLQVNVVVTMVI